jgi:hypothetical protein
MLWFSLCRCRDGHVSSRTNSCGCARSNTSTSTRVPAAPEHCRIASGSAPARISTLRPGGPMTPAPDKSPSNASRACSAGCPIDRSPVSAEVTVIMKIAVAGATGLVWTTKSLRRCVLPAPKPSPRRARRAFKPVRFSRTRRRVSWGRRSKNGSTPANGWPHRGVLPASQGSSGNGKSGFTAARPNCDQRHPTFG